jgi:hypothetical protein
LRVPPSRPRYLVRLSSGQRNTSTPKASALAVAIGFKNVYY